jgi:hypothetical protein
LVFGIRKPKAKDQSPNRESYAQSKKNSSKEVELCRAIILFFSVVSAKVGITRLLRIRRQRLSASNSRSSVAVAESTLVTRKPSKRMRDEGGRMKAAGAASSSSSFILPPSSLDEGV